MIWSQLLQMGGGMGGWTVGFLGPLVGLLAMAAIVVALWSVLSTGASGGGDSNRADDAMETLRRRYARGEIDDETFESRARTLRER